MNTLNLDNTNIFQGEVKVLSDVNFSIAKGELVYLIGKTGSGKSSLMKTLYADLPLIDGTGSVVGFNLKTLTDNDIPYLRRKIGIVFQDFKLLTDRNVFDNLKFVLKSTGWEDENAIKTKIEKVLKKVGMLVSINKMPHQMSGGEQQRIAIARALLNDPELILADEPTGNLDPKTSTEVMEVLKKINESGQSILMATHDYALILKYPSRTIKIENGNVFDVNINK